MKEETIREELFELSRDPFIRNILLGSTSISAILSVLLVAQGKPSLFILTIYFYLVFILLSSSIHILITRERKEVLAGVFKIVPTYPKLFPWAMIGLVIAILMTILAFFIPQSPVFIGPAIPETLAATPTATSTMTPTLTSTIEPSETPTQTATATDTPTLTSTATPTSSATPVILADRESPMVFIPAGYFQMYAKSGTAQTYVNGFYIDQHEVTNAEYQKCVITGGCSKPFSDAASQYANVVHFKDTAYDNYPVVLVSWHMAQNYCKWRGAGTRLPTDVEWEKAARGGLVNQSYPWGSTTPVCSPGSLNGANFLDCGSKDVVPVEMYAPNGYGIYDMAGNASEWVDKVISGDVRMIRGGSWYDSANQLTVYSSAQGSYLDGYINVGFRCAKSSP